MLTRIKPGFDPGSTAQREKKHLERTGIEPVSFFPASDLAEHMPMAFQDCKIPDQVLNIKSSLKPGGTG